MGRFCGSAPQRAKRERGHDEMRYMSGSLPTLQHTPRYREPVLWNYIIIVTMKLSAKNFLARAQRFVVRPPPGWADVTLDEVRAVLHTPYSKYKFEPVFLNNASMLNADGNIEILNCDFRQGMELTTRLMTAHDVQWVVEDLQCKEHKDIKRACFQFPFAIFINPAHSLSDISIDVRAHASGSFADSSKMLKDFFYEGLETFGKSNGDAESTRALLRSRKKASLFDAPVSQFDLSQKRMFTMKLHNARLTITANMCGEPLYKRGFKQQALSGVAPLPEHHAAAAYYWAHNFVFPSSGNANDSGDSNLSANICKVGWFRSPAHHPHTVHIPFAGSGTLGIEALSLILGACPGSHADRHFLVSNFNQTPASTMDFIRKKNSPAGVTSAPATEDDTIILEIDTNEHAWSKNVVMQFAFSDINADALKSTRENVENFVGSVATKESSSTDGEQTSNVFCSFKMFDFLAPGASNKALVGGKGGKLHHHCVLLNPPYGKRLDTGVSPIETYRQLSRAVQAMRYCTSNKSLRKDITISGYCLCPDEATWKAFSSNQFANLFSCKTRHFTHGGTDMRVIAFASK